MGSTQQPLEAVIFDMDGTLVDSEPMWNDTAIEIFGKVGVELNHEMMRQTTGFPTNRVVQYWFERYPWDENIMTRAQLADAIVARMLEHMSSEPRAKPGVAEAIGYAKSLGVPLAVASASPRSLIEAAINGLGLSGVFGAVASGYEEKHGKPHPAVYLTAAERLGVDPTRCVAIEDSLPGVVSAKAANMRVIAVPDQVQSSPKYAIADVIIKSLNEFNEHTLNKALS